jgi:hypothetical protein
MTQQCMGGRCTRRDKCAHYWAPKQRNVPPVERLCGPVEVPAQQVAMPTKAANV